MYVVQVENACSTKLLINKKKLFHKTKEISILLKLIQFENIFEHLFKGYIYII